MGMWWFLVQKVHARRTSFVFFDALSICKASGGFGGLWERLDGIGRFGRCSGRLWKALQALYGFVSLWKDLQALVSCWDSLGGFGRHGEVLKGFKRFWDAL